VVKSLSRREPVRYTKTRKRRLKTTEDEQEPLDPAKARARVFQRAGKLLAAKQRTVEELRERLLEGRGATRAAVDEVIERLREYGYLDDARFAHGYASLRVQQRPIGRQRLERDLRMKQIDKHNNRSGDQQTHSPARPAEDARRSKKAVRSLVATGFCL
jgi:SOS response regulatory protein OraA/RecX